LGRGAVLDQVAPCLPASAPLHRDLPPVAPLVIIRAASPMPVQPPPSWPSCEAVRHTKPLSLGAGRLFELLHRLACETGQARAYAVVPDTVLMHLPASLVALGLGHSRRHLYRLLPELVEAGLLAHGGQAQMVNGMGLYSGCLWAVKVKPGNLVPSIRREDWKYQFRDFAGDIEAGRTVKGLLEGMSHLQTQEQKEVLGQALKTWAVTPGRTQTPVMDVAVTCDDAGLLELSYRLGNLVSTHPSKLAEAVGRMGSALSRALQDTDSRRWYCQLLWRALEEEREGRGGIRTLAAALARLEADRSEWADLRNPAALLAARLRSNV
jgi:hypothetical protein